MPPRQRVSNEDDHEHTVLWPRGERERVWTIRHVTCPSFTLTKCARRALVYSGHCTPRLDLHIILPKHSRWLMSERFQNIIHALDLHVHMVAEHDPLRPAERVIRSLTCSFLWSWSKWLKLRARRLRCRSTL